MCGLESIIRSVGTRSGPIPWTGRFWHRSLCEALDKLAYGTYSFAATLLMILGRSSPAKIQGQIDTGLCESFLVWTMKECSRSLVGQTLEFLLLILDPALVQLAKVAHLGPVCVIRGRNCLSFLGEE